MKNSILSCGVLVVVLGIMAFVPNQALAAKQYYLASSPLTTGSDGEHNCSCVNLSDKTIRLNIIIEGQSAEGMEQSSFSDTDPGKTKTFSTGEFSAASCKVEQVSYKPLNKKKVVCSFSAVDVNGSPQFVLPVDKKFMRKF